MEALGADSRAVGNSEIGANGLGFGKLNQNGVGSATVIVLAPAIGLCCSAACVASCSPLCLAYGAYRCFVLVAECIAMAVANVFCN